MYSDLHFLILPGYGNSEPAHWQSIFESKCTHSTRIEVEDWFKPVCSNWVESIQKSFESISKDRPIVVVAHSLGCIAYLHWRAKYIDQTIAFAFLVAPPNLEKPALDLSIEGFLPLPHVVLQEKKAVVYSSNDPWASVEFSCSIVEKYTFTYALELKNAGHVNVEAGFGNWEIGLKYLQTCMQEASQN